MLTDYFGAEHFKAWIDWLAEQKGIGELDTEALEKGMEALRATLF